MTFTKEKCGTNLLLEENVIYSIYIVQSVQFRPVVIKVQEGQAVTSSS